MGKGVLVTQDVLLRVHVHDCRILKKISGHISFSRLEGIERIGMLGRGWQNRHQSSAFILLAVLPHETLAGDADSTEMQSTEERRFQFSLPKTASTAAAAVAESILRSLGRLVCREWELLSDQGPHLVLEER